MRTLRLLSVLLTALTLTLALAAGSAARAANPAAAKQALPQPAKSQPAPAALATSPTATQRSFVSGLGSDANPCTRTQPCRNFAKAISETLANGEVIVLDSAGYGPFTVDKSIDIIAPAGVYAGVTAFSGDGVTVNAPGATVVLRGLTVNGLGGQYGVRLLDADKLYLQQMTLKRFSLCCRAGLFVSTAGSPRIFVEDSVAHDNYVGLWQYAGTSRMTLVNSRLEGNDYGLAVEFGKATVRETLLAGNPSAGVYASGTGTEVALEHATVAENDPGIFSQSSAIVRISETMVTRNGTGLLPSAGGQIVSWGNNRVAGNTANGAPTSTIPQV